MRGFADRTVINTQVQGAAADLIKIALVNIEKQVLYPEERTKRVILLSTVHDELNFSVSAEEPFFTKTVLALWELMRVKVPGWPVDMDVELSIGNSWGEVYPFEYEEGVGFVPVRETAK